MSSMPCSRESKELTTGNGIFKIAVLNQFHRRGDWGEEDREGHHHLQIQIDQLPLQQQQDG
jgi:hypothetical protein